MSGTFRLGLRLAGAAAAPGVGRAARVRSMMVLVSAAVGTLVLLVVAAIVRSEILQRPSGYVEGGITILLVSVVIAIGLPVLTLATTSGRLSAAMRDRRLANLRLLGLTPAQTRVIAAVETGAAAAVGSVAGLAGFLLGRPVIAELRPAGRVWPLDTLWPHWWAAILAIVAVPLTVIAVSAVPRRATGRDVLGLARQADARRPHWLRVLPVIVGLVLILFVLANAENQYAQDSGSNDWLSPYMLAGIALLGLGTISVVPVFVRLVADVLVRRTDRPALVIAGRRLQAQPAATTRVVAGLLIGLFVVTGARAVVVAFEDTPQYRAAALTETTGQIGGVVTSRGRAESVRTQLEARADIRSATPFPRLSAGCRGRARFCVTAYVGTCADLSRVMPGVQGCRDDRPVWIGSENATRLPGTGNSVTFRALKTNEQWGEALTVPRPDGVATDPHGHIANAAINAEVLIPPSLPGVGSTVQGTAVAIVVRVPAGSSIDRYWDPPGASGGWSPETSYYEFVHGLRSLVWAIAAVIMSVGLLAFGVAAIDRAVYRRSEAVSLRLAGVDPGLLRLTQWIETVIPIGLGSLVAIGLGLLAGTGFLAYGSIMDQAPWQPTLVLAVVAVGASVLVASATVIAASPPIRAHEIRAE